MFYQSRRMKLECVRVVKKSEVNDILICRDLNTAAESLYTLLVIKEHLTAKRCLEVFWRDGAAGRKGCIDSFSHRGNLCMVFEYRQERLLKDFYMGKSYTLSQCRWACIQVIMACMACGLPYPVLYLILKQEQLHFSRDHGVYLGYQIDLKDLDAEKGERDCAAQCALIVKELLRPKASRKDLSWRLLEKRTARNGYHTFTELYGDMKISGAAGKEPGLKERIWAWLSSRQERIFRILAGVCLAAAAICLVSLLSQILFGDIVWLRFFFNGFKAIGTENLA